MRKFTILFVILLYIVHCKPVLSEVEGLYIPLTFAADSTPSSDIKSKLAELEKEIASKAAKLKQQISSKLSNKAYIGKVKTASKNTITIATTHGPKLVNINQDTVFESNVKGKKYSQKLISEEDYLAALGDCDETGVLTAKKVILLKNQTAEAKTFLWGQITAISGKLITLKDRNSKTQTVSIDDPGAVKLSNFVIFTGITGKNDIFEAEFAYVIPQGGILQPKKLATSSAQIASPSGKKQ